MIVKVFVDGKVKTKFHRVFSCLNFKKGNVKIIFEDFSEIEIEKGEYDLLAVEDE